MLASRIPGHTVLPAATVPYLLPYGLNAAQPVSVSGSRWEEQELLPLSPPRFQEIPLNGIQSHGHASLQLGYTAVDYTISS